MTNPIRRWVAVLALLGLLVGLGAQPADAQGLPKISLQLEDAQNGGDAAVSLQIIFLLTILSLAPSILIMLTSFIRIMVVLSFLRTAMGTQQTPPNQVLVSLALFLTLFVMMPTFEAAFDQGIKPMIEEEIDEFQAFERSILPFRNFMKNYVREQDLELFASISKLPDDEIRGEKMPMRILIPAYMISELRRAFEIGFLIFIPFLIAL